jgi:hypothetical protein
VRTRLLPLLVAASAAGCVVPHVFKPRLDLGVRSEALLPLPATIVVRESLIARQDTLARDGFVFIDTYRVATGATLTDGLRDVLRRDFTRVEVVTAEEPPAGAELTVQPYGVFLSNTYEGEQRLFQLDTLLLVTRAGHSTLFRYSERVEIGNATALHYFADAAYPPIMVTAPRELFERTLRTFREELLDHLLLHRPIDAPKSSADVGDVLRVLMRHSDELAGCVADQRKNGSVRHGVLQLQVRVEPSGEPSILAPAPEGGAEPIVSCAAGKVKAWRYPSFERASEPIDVPLHF